MLSPKLRTPSKSPLPVATYRFPEGSTESGWPDCQIPPRSPSGVTQSTPTCCSVDRAVGHDPAVIGIGVPIRCPGNVDVAIGQRQARALVFHQGIEGDATADIVVTGARDGSLDNHRAAEFFRARGYVQSMKSLHVVDGAADCFFRPRDQIHGSGRLVDHRSTHDADRPRRPDIALGPSVRRRYRCNAGAVEIHVPQGLTVGSLIIVGVECVHAVVVRRHVDRVMHALALDVDSGDDERLGVDVGVDGVAEQFAELSRIDVRRIELGFGEIGAGAGVIVAMGPDIDLGPRAFARENSQPKAAKDYLKDSACRLAQVWPFLDLSQRHVAVLQVIGAGVSKRFKQCQWRCVGDRAISCAQMCAAQIPFGPTTPFRRSPRWRGRCRGCRPCR